eukprot:GHVS01027212.1.p1 GENE.GHVS01027212.1~~GHVS01027212.1.p1  ORF type:complete len:749 (-),score=85.61 GHVS01027212.1:337-2583(-)
MSVMRVVSLACMLSFLSVIIDTTFCSRQLIHYRLANLPSSPVHRELKIPASVEAPPLDTDNEGQVEQPRISTKSSEDSVSWVDTKLCLSLSVLFCLSAVLISACTIFGHSVHYNVPSQQRYVVRLLFFVPVYAVGSLLILMFSNYFLYFEVLRDVWEAVVVYSFFSLILDYCGGENACAVEIARFPGSINHTFPLPFIGRRLCLLDICRPLQLAMTHPIPLNLTFVKNCKRCVLQFILLKPFMAIVSIIMYSIGLYHEWGFYWICLGFVYNVSVCTALYGLLLFYMATRHHSQLVGRRPVRKFVAIKLVIIATWYQGFLLGLLPGFDIIHATKWNNFLLCIEMPFFAALNAIAYPISEFGPRAASTVTTITMDSSTGDAPSVFGKNPTDAETDRSQGWPGVSFQPVDSPADQTGWAVGVDGRWRTGLVVGDVVGAKGVELSGSAPLSLPTFGSTSVRDSMGDDVKGDAADEVNTKEQCVELREQKADTTVELTRNDSSKDRRTVQGHEEVDERDGVHICENPPVLHGRPLPSEGTVKMSSWSLGGDGVKTVDSANVATPMARASSTEPGASITATSVQSSSCSSESLEQSDVGKGPREGRVGTNDGLGEQDVAVSVVHEPVTMAGMNGSKGEHRLEGEKVVQEQPESPSGSSGASNSAAGGVLKGGIMGRPMQILRNAIGDRQSHEKALKNVCDAVMMTDVVTDAYYNFNAKYHSHALLIDHSSEDDGGESEPDAREEHTQICDDRPT